MTPDELRAVADAPTPVPWDASALAREVLAGKETTP